MKLIRMTILAAAALVLAACSQATSSGGGSTTVSSNIENFQEFTTNTQLTTDWTIGYAQSTAVTPSVALVTGSGALGGTASMTASYGEGSSETYILTDFSINSPAATSKLFTNLTSNYTSGRTGISITFKASNFDTIRLYIRKTGNVDVYEGDIATGSVTTATQTVKIPFNSFTVAGFSTSDGLVSSLRAGLAAGAFNNFTIETECDDSGAAAGATRTLQVESVQYY